MVAYMRAQEEMRKLPVPSMNTPRRQLTMADIFAPLEPKICSPGARNFDEPNVRVCRAISDKQELKINGKRADFSRDFDNLGGQKKLGKFSNCGVKRVRSDQGVKPAEDINTCEDQGKPLISESADSTSSIAFFIEKDSGQVVA